MSDVIVDGDRIESDYGWCGPCEGKHLLPNKTSCWRKYITKAGRKYEGGYYDGVETDPVYGAHKDVLLETLDRVDGGLTLADSPAACIKLECRRLEGLLLKKNAAYGNSALDPVRIFSKANPSEQLRVRLDDKLSRIVRGRDDLDDEEVIDDLLGYLVLLKIASQEASDGQ